MFKKCSIYDCNIVFNSNYDYETCELSNEEFELLIIEKYKKRDFYHIYILSYINFDILVSYKFLNKECREILVDLNLIKIKENILFIEANFMKVFDVIINIYDDLSRIKVVDVSELIVIKNFLRSVLFLKNPHLLSPDYLNQRMLEDQKLSLIMLKHLNLSSLRIPDEDRANWFTRLFAFSSITDGLSTYYDVLLIKNFFKDYFQMLTHDKYYDQNSINNLLIDMLMKKDYDLFNNIYMMFEGKVFDIVVFELALAVTSFSQDFYDALKMQYIGAKKDYFKKLKEFYKEMGGDTQEIIDAEILSDLKKRIGKDKEKGLIYSMLALQYKKIKKIDKKYDIK